jgi:hypothetical protein
MKISVCSIVSMLYYLMSSIVFSMSLVIEKQEEEQQEEIEAQIQGIPICGANLSSPVVDQAYYIEEIHYRIGKMMYIENAD